MDINDLYRRQQIAIYMAEHAGAAASRAVHLRLAEGYAAQIEAARRLDPLKLLPDPCPVVAFRNVEIVA
jgi:hypothetical protein